MNLFHRFFVDMISSFASSKSTKALAEKTPPPVDFIRLQPTNSTEERVSYFLSQLPNYGVDFKLINNIILPNIKTEPSQIDHILISKYGLFVIETKNWGGSLKGTITNKQWTRINYSKKRSFSLNPIRQVNSHCMVIQNILNFPTFPCYKVVAFAEQTNIDGLNLEDSDTTILHISQLNSFVLSKTEIVLSSAEIESLYNFLVSKNEDGVSSKIEGLYHMERHATQSKNKAKYGRCPGCGAPLKRYYSKICCSSSECPYNNPYLLASFSRRTSK